MVFNVSTMSADAMGVTHCVKHMNISLIISVYFRTTRYHKDIIFKSSDLLQMANAYVYIEKLKHDDSILSPDP